MCLFFLGHCPHFGSFFLLNISLSWLYINMSIIMKNSYEPSLGVQNYQDKRRRDQIVMDCDHGVHSSSSHLELYFVFMEYDPECERLRSSRSRDVELDMYLSKKHDILLETVFPPGSYKKRFSWAIIDGFAVEITDEQANRLRAADGVRMVEKNLEL